MKTGWGGAMKLPVFPFLQSEDAVVGQTEHGCQCSATNGDIEETNKSM